MKRSIAMMIVAASCATVLTAQTPDKERKVQRVVVRNGEVLTLRDGEVLGAIGRGYIGVHLVSLTPELRQHFGAPKESGVLVSKVSEDSPAARAGIRVGDVITSIAGETVESTFDLGRGIRNRKEGEQVSVEVIRNGARQKYTLTVANRPARRVELDTLGELPLIIAEEGREIAGTIGDYFNSPEWKAKVAKLRDCGESTDRIRDLEKRLQDLEKKVEKK
jgi:predicted metalloprotease with PDZ domain